METNNMNEIDELFGYSFDERILWQFSLSKARMFLYQMQYMCIGPVAFFLLGCILAIAGIITWWGLLYFGGVTLLSLAVISFALLQQKRSMIYTVTETKIIINYPALCCVADFSDIVKITKSRSLFFKGVGTIKFKLKKGMSINYRFAKIDDVDSVYDLLSSLREKYN